MTDRTALFRQHRPRLYGIAYRMLGAKADAEGMLHEAYLRWHEIDVERVQTPQAWLVTAVTRLCIDRLRAARTEREAYIGPWLPEPLVSDVSPPADRQAELASDLSVAFLVVLERLAPEERSLSGSYTVLNPDKLEGDRRARKRGAVRLSQRRALHRLDV